VLYPALLVGIFLGAQLLLGMVGVPVDQQAAIAALPALFSLLLSLPLRLRRAWGAREPWRSLGVAAPAAAMARALRRGLIKAVLLLALLTAGLAVAWLLMACCWDWGWVLPKNCCFAVGCSGNSACCSVASGPWGCSRPCSAWCTPPSTCH
jgi:hypothetical protein